jgi:hypothetical protein
LAGKTEAVGAVRRLAKIVQRRPLIKGYFAALRLIVGAVMSSAYLNRVMTPVALMLSADPLPKSYYRAECAVNATGFGIKPRSSHHLLVTLDSCAALGR